MNHFMSTVHFKIFKLLIILFNGSKPPPVHKSKILEQNMQPLKSKNF